MCISVPKYLIYGSMDPPASTSQKETTGESTGNYLGSSEASICLPAFYESFLQILLSFHKGSIQCYRVYIGPKGVTVS